MFGIFGKSEDDIQKLIDEGKFDELPTKVIDSLAKDLIVTTEANMPEYRVLRRIEVITAECVFGSSAAQGVLRDARRTCLTELRREALMVGANAVIAVDLDYNEISGDGKSMLFVVATGTAVTIEPK